MINRIAYNICAQHHACAATCGGIIDISVFAIPETAQVDSFQCPFVIL
jgi:hypothetical protein